MKDCEPIAEHPCCGEAFDQHASSNAVSDERTRVINHRDQLEVDSGKLRRLRFKCCTAESLQVQIIHFAGDTRSWKQWNQYRRSQLVGHFELTASLAHGSSPQQFDVL